MQVLHLHPKQHGRCCLAARARLARAASRLVRTLPGRTHFSARAMALPLPARASLAHNLRSPCVCTPLCLCCTDLPTSTPPTPPPTARSRPTSPTVASRSEVTSSSLYYPHPILEIPPLSTSARRMAQFAACSLRLEAEQHSPQLTNLLFAHALCTQANDCYHRRCPWRSDRHISTTFRASAAAPSACRRGVSEPPARCACRRPHARARWSLASWLGAIFAQSRSYERARAARRLSGSPAAAQSVLALTSLDRSNYVHGK